MASHEESGELRWLSTIGEHRGFMGATDVTVDRPGNVLMNGGGSEYYLSRKSRTVVLLGVFGHDGQKLFEDRIRSVERSDENGGGSIACDQNGNTYFTGFLRGIPRFGTNVMGAGASEVPNAFVARRLTLQPRLTVQRHETNIVLRWPRPGMPFALQQKSAATSNTWSDVQDVPEVLESRSQVRLALAEAHCLFRLRMTNEEPIRHVPMMYPFHVVPSSSFLGQSPVLLTSSNSVPSPSVTGWAEDEDENPLSFTWFNVNSGEQLTNGTSSQLHYTSAEERPFYSANLTDPNLMLQAGSHTISLTAFDGAFYATNAVTLDVLAVETALDRLIAAVNATGVSFTGYGLVEPLLAARSVYVQGSFSSAVIQVREFQRRLAEVFEFTEAQKYLFHDAAETIINTIPEEPPGKEA